MGNLPQDLILQCPIIDGDHAVLLQLVGELDAALAAGAPKAGILELAVQLSAYFDAHFENEEELMEQSGFDASAPHIVEHRDVQQRFEGYVNAYRDGDDAAPAQLLATLRAWMVSHVQGTDVLLAGHLLTRGMQGKAGERSLVIESSKIVRP